MLTKSGYTYKEARSEFINCLVFGVICFGIPFYFAATEWWPMMQRAKEEEQSQASHLE